MLENVLKPKEMAMVHAKKHLREDWDELDQIGPKKVIGYHFFEACRVSMGYVNEGDSFLR